jgi:Type I restriction enzyme HindI endonuclease subunit-like, C-terminal
MPVGKKSAADRELAIQQIVSRAVVLTEIVNRVGDKRKNNATVDWMHREMARARMRVLVKRLLRKYGYPPDLQDAAVQNVLHQAEALSRRDHASIHRHRLFGTSASTIRAQRCRPRV